VSYSRYPPKNAGAIIVFAVISVLLVIIIALRIFR